MVSRGTGATLPSTSSSGVTQNSTKPSNPIPGHNKDPSVISDIIHDHLPKILAGALFVFCALVFFVAFVAWKRRARRLSQTMDNIEEDPEKAESYYVEIGDVQHITKKKNKKKGKPSKKQSRNNDLDHPEEVIALDTAPDIITAHDSESIYETIDGRRAARAKASQDCAPADTTYDHLHTHSAPLPHAHLLKRLTDPEISTRVRHQLEPRVIHSANGLIQSTPDSPARISGDPRGSESSGSSLTELARQSGGKQIVCQLTMVGVMQNGKPVPLQQPAAANAYFVLESGADPATSELKHCESRFRIKNDTAPVNTLGSRKLGGTTTTAPSEYFTLEPLEGGEDASELIILDNEPLQHYKTEAPDSEELQTHVGHQVMSSDALAAAEDGSEDEEQCQKCRTHRINSCPSHCESPKSPIKLAPYPWLRGLDYKRSVSSPQSSQHRRKSSLDSPSGVKLDAETLKARIQQEMVALGFVPDAERETCRQQRSPVFPPSHGNHAADQPARNDYYSLEPDSDEDIATEDPENVTNLQDVALNPPLSPDDSPELPPRPNFEREKNAGAGGPRRGVTKLPAKPDVHPKPRSIHQETPQLPPRPPREAFHRGHNRSRSETPVFLPEPPSPSPRGLAREDGPVVVSLKTTKASDPADVSGLHRQDSTFRPRFMSEAGLSFERIVKKS